MSLKLKLLSFIFLSAFCPITILGVYQSYNRYHSQLDDAQSLLKEDLQSRIESTSSLLNGASQNILFISKVAEVSKLITGIEDEDLDEINFWQEGLATVFSSFLTSQKHFTDIRFTTIEGKNLVRITYENNQTKNILSEKTPDGFKNSVIQKKPSVIFIHNSEKMDLWLHILVGDSNQAVISAKMELSEFYKLLEDQEVFLVSAESIVIDKGKPVTQVNSTLPGLESVDSAGLGETKDTIYTLKQFLPISWSENTIFTLYKIRSKDKIMGPILNSIMEIIIICLTTTLLAIGIGYLWLSKSLINPLLYAIGIARQNAKGDLTATIKPLKTSDEMGQLVLSLKTMNKEMCQMLQSISLKAGDLQDSASHLNSISSDLTKGTDSLNIQTRQGSENTSEMNNNLSTVSAAAEELSVNMHSVSDNVSQSASSLNDIASATEEMSTTIDNIAENTSMAKEVSMQAVSDVGSVTEQVGKLETAAGEINKVIDVIIEISEQTKLLALNATIEAARAGDMGKGFAVVASEVKDLAAQTNIAINEIGGKINEMKSATQTTVQNIGNIDKIIKNVNEIVIAIASSVEEQSITTKDIVSNISYSSTGVNEVSHLVTEAATAVQHVNSSIFSAAGYSQNVATGMQEVDQDTDNIKQETRHISEKVTELAEMGKELTKIVNKFKLPE
jgi:methyl-accepting chemotaxis protein